MAIRAATYWDETLRAAVGLSSDLRWGGPSQWALDLELRLSYMTCHCPFCEREVLRSQVEGKFFSQEKSCLDSSPNVQSL